MQAWNKGEEYFRTLLSRLDQMQAEEEKQQAASDDMEKKIFSIGSSEGSLTIQGKDGSYRPMSRGTMIAAGDKVKTGQNGRISITTPEGNIVEVGPNSEFVMEEPEKESLTLSAGKLWAKFKHMAIMKRFKVRTPYAVCSVRGTEFVVEYDENTQETNVHLYEGQLEITNINDEIYNLEAGNSMKIDSAGLTSIVQMQENFWNTKLAQIAAETAEGKAAVSDANTKKIFVVLAIVGACFLAYGIFVSKLKRYNDPKSVALGIVGLIVSIFSIPFCIFPFLGLPLAIVAVLFSNAQKKNNPTKAASVARVIGIIGIIVNAIAAIAFIGYLSSIPGA